MIIIGADYHPGFQQIAFVDTETGDYRELQLQRSEEAEKFYRELAAHGMTKVRVGMEASGHARWFERLLRDLQLKPDELPRVFGSFIVAPVGSGTTGSIAERVGRG